MKMILRNGSTYFSYNFYRPETVSIISKAGQSETAQTKQTQRRKNQWIDSSYAFHSTEHTMRTAQNKQSLCQAECSVSTVSLEKYIYWYSIYNNVQRISFQDSQIWLKVHLKLNEIPLQKPNICENKTPNDT